MPNEINLDRRRILGAAAMSIAAAQLGIVGSTAAQFAIDGESPSFAGASAWLNSQPLQMRALRGKVVLVNFWTYTCINSLRVLPYVRAWAEKYKAQGLVVIGVQAPEFSFEKNIDNVRWAINAMKIDYPVAVDNDHAVWRAFNNEVWPALYFVDARGAFDTINSARAITNSRNGPSNNCSSRPVPERFPIDLFRSMPKVRKPPPIGAA